MGETVKYTLDESKLPEAWYNVAADLPEPPAPVLHPGTGQPVGPDDLAPLFPMEVILQEVSTEERIAIPEEVRAVYRQWRPTPLYRARRLEQALDTPGPDLLQVRGRLADGEPQAEHRRRAGVLQRARGREADHDRDGRGPVGVVARLRGLALRARDRRLHGAGLVRPEAVPARADGGLRRAVRPEPVGGDGLRPRDPRRASGLDREPRDRDLRGGRAGGPARRHEVRARLRPEPRAPPSDGDRRGGARADGPRRRLPGRPHRLHRRRLELRGARVPVRRREAPRRRRRARDRGRAGRLPEPHARRARLRLRRHRAT